MTTKRSLILALLPLTLALGCPKTGSTGGGSTVTDIELTGIDSFDSVFREARDLDERFDSAKAALDSGRTTLNSALGLAEGTPFADAIADLQAKAQGKLQVAVDEGGGLSLQASDAVPANVQAAVDSLNATLASYKAAVADLAGAKDDITSLVNATKSFPSQLQSDFKNLDLSLNEVPGKLETVRDNVRIIGNMPERVDKLGGAMQDNIAVVTGTFGGGGRGATAASPSSPTTSTEQGTQSEQGTTAPSQPRTLKRK
ncbi:hypothetical protein L6R53_00505 [Myxococcota bacterium]|nr:hypothetical protein [Myxococcota bacterium]